MDTTQHIDIPEQNFAEMSWSFADFWNNSLDIKTEREMVARDYCWASELGGAMVDRYLRMTGVPPTNPPNSRSYRKFDAGNLWEGIVKFVLNRAGVIIKAQEHLEYQYPELLKVTGRLDFYAGGTPDWDKARQSADEVLLFLEEQKWKDRVLFMIDRLQEKYHNDLKKIVLEIKSCSTYSFDRYAQTRKPNPNHQLQLFHYLKSKNMREGHVVYICKDDCRVLEFPVFNPSPVEDLYKEDIAEITRYFKEGIQPEAESQLLFDVDRGVFQKNWKVEYSGYLSMLYGYETPEQYRESWDGKIRRLNSLLTRIVEEKKLTPLNLETLTMAKEFFPDSWTNIVDIAKSLKAEGKLVEDPVEVAKIQEEKTEK